jgi:hypothetical protein
MLAASLGGRFIYVGRKQLGRLDGRDASAAPAKDAIGSDALAGMPVYGSEAKQIVGQLLTEEPFAAHGVGGRQQPGPRAAPDVQTARMRSLRSSVVLGRLPQSCSCMNRGKA